MDVELSAEPTECKTQLNHLVRADFDIDYFSSRLYFIIYSECHRSFVVCSNLWKCSIVLWACVRLQSLHSTKCSVLIKLSNWYVNFVLFKEQPGSAA